MIITIVQSCLKKYRNFLAICIVSMSNNAEGKNEQHFSLCCNGDNDFIMQISDDTVVIYICFFQPLHIDGVDLVC